MSKVFSVPYVDQHASRQVGYCVYNIAMKRHGDCITFLTDMYTLEALEMLTIERVFAYVVGKVSHSDDSLVGGIFCRLDDIKRCGEGY